MNWTKVNDREAYLRAIELAKGPYQRNLLQGWESLSGSTIQGRARAWANKYRLSRLHLLQRLRAAGIPVSEERGPRGKRILVIG